MSERQWLSAGEAMARLGVKSQTLYAYVSRGLIRRERVAGSRTSRYLRSDVERLAERARRTASGNGPEIIIDSAITRLDPSGRLAYRGWDVTRAAVDTSYETIAEWLWAPEADPETPWRAPRERVEGREACAGCPPGGATIPDRLRVTAAAIGACDPLRNDRRRPSVAARACGLIATLVESLPVVARERTVGRCHDRRASLAPVVGGSRSLRAEWPRSIVRWCSSPTTSSRRRHCRCGWRRRRGPIRISWCLPASPRQEVRCTAARRKRSACCSARSSAAPRPPRRWARDCATQCRSRDSATPCTKDQTRGPPRCSKASAAPGRRAT